MNEVQYYRMEESAAIADHIAQNLKAILDAYGARNVTELHRAIYRETDCGPWLSVQAHDGEWKHIDQLGDIENGNVRALRAGCIRERRRGYQRSSGPAEIRDASGSTPRF